MQISFYVEKHFLISVSIDSKTLEIFSSLLPDLKIERVELVSVGWNSTVYILNNQFTVKIPRNQKALSGLEKEIAIFDTIRGRLPVEIPHYVSSTHLAENHAFAYGYIGGSMMTTRPLGEDVKLFDPTTVKDRNLYTFIQKQLAEILSSIHGIKLDAVRDTISRFEHKNWAQSFIELGEIFEAALVKVLEGNKLTKAKSVLEETIDSIAHFSFQEKFLHGDFGGWNIIYDEELGKIKGIIDWADCNIGDPAIDFSELIYDYGWKYAHEVSQLYSSDNVSDTLERAKVYLRLEGFRDLHYGLETNTVEFLEIGKRNIEKIISGFNH